MEWCDGIDFTDAVAAATAIAAEFDGWAPELAALITNADTAPVARMIHSLPDTHRWDRTSGVTLLGDAAHLMPPSGEGGTLAMLDGAELGLAIAANPDDTEAALIALRSSNVRPQPIGSHRRTRDRRTLPARTRTIRTHRLLDQASPNHPPDGVRSRFRRSEHHPLSQVALVGAL